MCHRNRVFMFCMAIIIVIVSLATPISSLAFITGPKWDLLTIHYRPDPNNDARLGIANSVSIVDNAAALWNRSSPLVLVRSDVYDTAGNIVTTQNFKTAPPCGARDSMYGATCYNVLGSDPNRLAFAQMYLNVSPSVQWNTSGTVNCSASPKQMDLLTIVLHEFGHFMFLGDNPPTAPDAVMNFACIPKRTLREDDLDGKTQIYGPRTSFETDQAVGRRNTIAYAQNIVNYNNAPGTSPELGPVASELGVPTMGGLRYSRLAGTAQAGYSYAYMRLFSYLYDSTPLATAKNYYIKIECGMKLRWYQYN